MSGWAPDPAFEAGSAAVAELALCHLRWSLDARWPWAILLPRAEAAVEIEDLTAADRARLLEEAVAVGRAVRAAGAALGWPVAKLNIASLGNVTPQLHLHVVGRRPGDPAWPGPVWGAPGAEPYAPDALAKALATVRGALGG